MCRGFFHAFFAALQFLKDLLVVSLLILFGCVKCCVPLCCRKKKSVKGKVVLITGGANGIGRLMAVKFAKLGAKVITVDNDELANAETEAIVTGAGHECHSLTCDVGQLDSVKLLKQSVIDLNIGRVDILINNAGIVVGKMLLDLTECEIERTIRVNLLGQFWMLRAFLPDMLEANDGHIVTVSSVAGIVGTSHLTDYSASKFGDVGLTESLAVELDNLKKTGVKTTLVCPYYIDTGMFAGIETKFNCLLAIQKPKYVANTIVNAVLAEYELVYIPRMIYVLLAFKGILPSRVVRYLGFMFGAHTAMQTFKGRDRHQSQLDNNGVLDV